MLDLNQKIASPNLYADQGGSYGAAHGTKQETWNTDRLIGALEQGDVQAFNLHRPKSGAIDLSGIDLTGKSLRGVNFEGVNLSRAKLLGCDLTSAVMDRAILEHADLSKTILDGVHAHSLKANHIIMRAVRQAIGADFNSSEMEHADMSDKSNFAGGKFAFCKMSYSQFNESNFSGGDFTEVIAKHSDCTSSNFSKTYMVKMNLWSSILADTVFEKANMEGINLVLTTSVGKTSFAGSNLTDADARMAIYKKETSFKGAYIKGFKSQGFGTKAQILKDAHDKPAPAEEFKKEVTVPTTINLLYGIPGTNREAFNLAEQKLDALIGMESFKDHMHEIIGKLEDDLDRQAAGLPVNATAHHELWIGESGTGKNTGAEIAALYYYAFGLIDSPEMVYLKKEDLVKGAIGQSEAAAVEFIEKVFASRRFVYIDEAYQFAEGGEKDFGRRVLGVLLTKIENNRFAWCSAWAGYKNEMDNLLKANSGLRSRFTNTEEFRSFSSGELVDILRKQMDDYNYTYNHDVLAAASVILTMNKEFLMADGRGNEFGNARVTRNVYEAIKHNQPKRTKPLKAEYKSQGKAVPVEILSSVSMEDLPLESILNISASRINLSELTWTGKDESGKPRTYSYDDLQGIPRRQFPDLSPESIQKLLELREK